MLRLTLQLTVGVAVALALIHWIGDSHAHAPDGASGASTAIPDQASNAAVVAVDESTASASKPVLWFLDDTDDHLLVAYDWSGRLAGTMRLGATEPLDCFQSPDGTAVVLTHAEVISGAETIGRTSGLGHVGSRLDPPLVTSELRPAENRRAPKRQRRRHC